MKEQLAQVDDRDLDRVMAIIRSMTPEERQNPRILQASRKARVARGSGVTVTEVNQLLDRFDEAQKMMRQMAGGGIPGMRRASKKAAKKAGKRTGGKSAQREPGRTCGAAGGAGAGPGEPAGERAGQPVRPAGRRRRGCSRLPTWAR